MRNDCFTPNDHEGNDMDENLERFLELDRHIRDAYVAGNHLKVLAIAGTLAIYASDKALTEGLRRAKAHDAEAVTA